MSNQKLNKVEVDKPLIHPVEYKLDHPVLLAAEALLANQSIHCHYHQHCCYEMKGLLLFLYRDGLSIPKEY